MDETTLISTLQQRLASNLDVPVRTASHEDERPVPAVILDKWVTDDLQYHNSPYSGSFSGDPDDDGERDYKRYFRFYYQTRVDFLVRHSDEVAASRLKDDVKQVLRNIRIDPQDFHEHLNDCRPRESGSPSHVFTEPKETELGVAAIFEGFHQVVRSDYDTIEQVKDSFTITE